MPSSLDDFPALASVRVVCRECLSLREPPNVVLRIDEFLGAGSVERACILGSLRLMKFVAARDTKAHWGNVAGLAAQLGHLDILQWLSDFHADRCEWGNVLNLAAILGHLSVVKWLHTHRQDGCSTNAMDGAAERGHLNVVKWLHDNRTEGCTRHALNSALVNGDLDMIKWLYENRTEGA